MISWEVACSFELIQKVNDGNRVLSVKPLIFLPDGNFFSHLLHLSCNVVIVSLRLMWKTIQTLINGHLVPFIHRYQNFDAGFGIVLLMRRGVADWWRRWFWKCLLFPFSDCYHHIGYLTHSRTLRYCTSSGSSFYPWIGPLGDAKILPSPSFVARALSRLCMWLKNTIFGEYS